MKKIFKILTIVTIISITLVACGSKNPTEGNSEGEESLNITALQLLEEIQDQLKPELMLENTEMDLSDKDLIKIHLGLDSADDIQEAAMSNAMINTQAYFIAAIKVKEGVKSQELAKEIVKNVDPVKWICVSADDIQAAVSGDMILLVMINSELEAGSSADYFEQFETIVGKELDVIYKQ